jgi:hypothetical protein
MKIERTTFTITSILDRNGRRIANHIVDKSDDALNRDREDNSHSQDRPFVPEKPHDGDEEDKITEVASAKKSGLNGLNITA